MNTQINLHLVNEGSNIDRVVLINGENDGTTKPIRRSIS
mgnify:CR=1 FL=1